MSKVLILSSSYRKGSNSSELATQIGAGARLAGHTVNFMDISTLQINPCKGCAACLAPGSNGCIQQDDMQQVYPAIVEAESIIFASPIYWFNMSGQLKVVLDRCFAVAVNPDPNGKSAFAAKKLGVALSYGSPDPLKSGCVNAVRCFQDICAYTGAQWLGALYGSASAPGEMAQNEAMRKAALEYGRKL